MKRLTEEALAEPIAIKRPIPDRVLDHPGWRRAWDELFALAAKHRDERLAAERHDDEADAA